MQAWIRKQQKEITDSDENPTQEAVPQPDEAPFGEDEEEQPVAIQDDTRLPKIGNVIHYEAKDEGLWQTAKVLSRAGKVTGKYASWFNIEDLVTKKTSSIDFKNGIACTCHYTSISSI